MAIFASNNNLPLCSRGIDSSGPGSFGAFPTGAVATVARRGGIRTDGLFVHALSMYHLSCVSPVRGQDNACIGLDCQCCLVHTYV